ncbi:MAG: hypothetical protein BWX80_03548 [Candidatus Hydrogenedentes bacterium ADurb.Bin101]|nr:MAG: hypothetical protein BWX80_03548 [Candidatus Hydrogenedentes bacterium ADurb.Bin101]
MFPPGGTHRFQFLRRGRWTRLAALETAGSLFFHARNHWIRPPLPGAPRRKFPRGIPTGRWTGVLAPGSRMCLGPLRSFLDGSTPKPILFSIPRPMPPLLSLCQNGTRKPSTHDYPATSPGRSEKEGRTLRFQDDIPEPAKRTGIPRALVPLRGGMSLEKHDIAVSRGVLPILQMSILPRPPGSGFCLTG